MHLENKILENKLSFLESRCTSLNAWACLEQSIKDIIWYYSLFKSINFSASKLNIKKHKIISQILQQPDTQSISFEGLINILEWFQIIISKSDKKEVNLIYSDRNKNAHNNIIMKDSNNFFVIFDIINKFKIQIYSKISIDE